MQHQQLRYKIFCIAGITLLFFTGIIARLFYLQIRIADKLLEQSNKNHIRIERIQSPRGNIVDVAGNLLATNRPITNLYWQGSGNPLLSAEQHSSLSLLETILGTPFEQSIVTDLEYAEKKYKKIELANDLSFEQLSQVQEQLGMDENIRIETHFKRLYPYKNVACHVLGYLGSVAVDAQGKMGLEKLQEDKLRGDPGITIKKINSTGRSLTEIELKRSLNGAEIRTTLDIDMQMICEHIFPDDLSGTFIVMDPEDGSLLALVSRPNFDPNIFLDPLSITQWQTLQTAQPFLNRAFSSLYAPGSIFKLVTCCAALEQNLITPNATIFCGGYMPFCERNYWCARRNGHGLLTVSQALAQSCNILFYEIGKHISIDTLAHYAQKFGLGQKTNICFSEQAGLVPTTTWKQMTKRERWWPGETLSAAIGQSFLLVTPIQVARMISSIFTGYLVTPRILVDEPIEQCPLTIQPATLAFLRHSMKSVVTRGTGIRLSYVKDIEIYAKTSTAQVASFSKSSSSNAYLEHGWFVAYFKYKDHKPLTIVILAENVGTSRVVTPLAKNFLVEYKQLMNSRSEAPAAA